MQPRLLFLVAFVSFTSLHAATPIDLAQISSQSYFKNPMQSIEYKEVKRDVDLNNTTHVRLSQTYAGHKVWGGDGVVHIPNKSFAKTNFAMQGADIKTMNGIMYDNIDADIKSITNSEADLIPETDIIADAIKLYAEKSKHATTNITLKKSERIVYIDDNNRAHWAYVVELIVPHADNQHDMRPTYIIDAKDKTVYQTWNNLKTSTVLGGGHGGNQKTGKKSFDGINPIFPAFEIRREDNMCYLKNDRATIRRYETTSPLSFSCEKQDEKHNNVYWNGSFDQLRGSFSPGNDALFGVEVAGRMFNEWYKIPVLIDKLGNAQRIIVEVHLPDSNAYWEDGVVTFGDSVGDPDFNPFTSLDTVVHELGHGFTEQQSGLVYYGQPGGLNEAFSDMLGIAAEYFQYGKTDYLVGFGDVRKPNESLRYMDKPSKDCANTLFGDCSIDTFDDFYSGLDVHYSSGLFNRVFYLLATTKGWDPKKALSVMVQANRFYWVPTSNFANAACGVIKAAKDYKYSIEDVKRAFATVKINTKNCS